MNIYYYAHITRRDFGDLLSLTGLERLKIREAANTDFLSSPHENSLLALWSADPMITKQLPETLICQDDAINDWTAWLTTYVAKIRPFSAYMRLLSHSEFLERSENITTSVPSKLAWPAAGLILSEILAASGLSDKSLDTLAATAFTSTLSFVISRTAVLYPDYKDWNILIERWNDVRLITKQRERPVKSQLIANVCKTIISALNNSENSYILNRKDNEIGELCRIIFDSPQRNIPSLIFNSIGFQDADLILSGSREDRVVTFEHFLKSVNNFEKINSEMVAFWIGYLASRIAPRTIKHTSVLTPINSQYPTALLWYGFWAGFSNEGAEGGMQNTDFPPIARRIIRELFRPEQLIGIPYCDIAYSELIAMARTNKSPLEDITRTTQGLAIIELLPGVCTTVNVLQKQTENIKNANIHEKEIMNSMGKQIENLSETYKSLINGISSEKKSEQTSFLPPKRKKKNKKSSV